MGKPSAPTPPDPKVTAGAQTAQNIGTAIANNTMGNVNQVTPDGSLTYSTNGYEKFTDPNTGEVYDIPKYTATQTLSDAQQGLYDANSRAQTSLANLGADQAGRLSDLLASPMDLSGLPGRRNFDPSQAPEFGQYQSGPSAPQMQTNVGRANIQGMLDDAGNIQTGINSPSNYQTSAGGGNINDYQTSADRGAIASGAGDFTAQNSQIGGTGDIRSQLTQPGSINTSVDIPQISGLPSIFGGGGGGGGINYQASNLPSAQREFGASPELNLDANLPGYSQGNGPAQVDFTTSALTGPQSGFAQGPGVQYETGDAGDITRSYGTDFSADRQRVEDALIQRMDPYLQRDKQQLESRLASQGIRIGSEAYQDAMSDFSRQSNDARLGAIGAGGQEQSRLVGLEAQRAGFENAAQGQAFGQLRSQQDAFNAAQGQNFGQDLARGQFANAAQAQGAQQTIARDGQRLQASGMNAELQARDNELGLSRERAANDTALAGFTAGNQARNDAFGQSMQRGQFANDAIAQDNANTLAQDQLSVNAQEASGRLGLQGQANALQASTANARLQLDAQLANQQAALDAARFGNDAQAQQFGQELASGQFQNQTQQQQFDQNLTRTNTANDAATQQLMNQLAAGSFQNSAQAQDFSQQMQSANLNNTAQNDVFNQNLANANLNNSAQSDQFSQNLAAGNFANNAQGQQFSQNLAGAEFANGAQSQDFQQMLAQAGFGNAATQANFDNGQSANAANNSAIAANNSSAQQTFGNYMSGLDQSNADRSSALQEQFAARNQPINEIAALLGGSQVSQPNFVNTSSAQMPTTDVAGIISDNFAQQSSNYQTQMQARNAMLGNIFSLF